MKIFFDTEFTGLHKNTTLISIGMIAEDGEAFYAEFTDYDKSQCDDWIQENVIDNLLIEDCSELDELASNQYKGDKLFIREKLLKWFDRFDSDIQFVSDVSHYDFVLLIDLLGDSAFDLPSNVCPSCHDINQDIAEYHDESFNEFDAFNVSREDVLNNMCGCLPDGIKHNSLYDAKVIKGIYEWIYQF